MNTKRILNSFIAIFVIGIVFVWGFGCKKEKTSDLPDAATLASLNQAYTNAHLYNDSLLLCTNDIALWSHDSIKWKSMIHYYDNTYHHFEGSHTEYNNMCQKQFEGHSSSMMSNGMMGNNYSNYTNCISNMKALQQLHLQYHPHF